MPWNARLFTTSHYRFSRPRGIPLFPAVIAPPPLVDCSIGRLCPSGFRLQASEDFPTRGAGGHRSYRSYRSYKTYGLVPTHAELPGYPLDFARGKPATVYQLPATGYWLPATGYWLPATGYHPHRTATVGRMWRRKKSMAFSGTRSWLMLGMTFVSTWKPLDRRYAMAASVWAVIAPRSPSPT